MLALSVLYLVPNGLSVVGEIAADISLRFGVSIDDSSFLTLASVDEFVIPHSELVQVFSDFDIVKCVD